MRIGSTFGAGRTASSRGPWKSDAGGEAGFTRHLQPGGGDRAGAVGGLAPLAAMDSLLAVQALDDALEGRRRAVHHGKSLLDALDEVRLALLEGRLPAETLERLNGLVAQHRGRSDDPRLEAVLGEIELRAAVELAKLERA